MQALVRPTTRDRRPDRREERDAGRPPVVHIVDDDAAALVLLSEIAEDAGWIARGFTRLAELRDALRRERPALLILDDDLPDGSGGDLARELRNDPRLGDVPTVVCTGAHPMRRAAIGSWAPVVSKPFRIEELEPFLDEAARTGSGSHDSATG